MQEIKRAQMIEERRLELEISANNGNGGGGDSGDDWRNGWDSCFTCSSKFLY